MAALVRASDRLRKEVSRIALPLLVLHGTADKATRPRGSEYFHQHAASPDKTLKIYDGHFHDLLDDLGRESVMADITDWIGAQLPAAR